MFITFEGPEGSGKTTQAELLSDFLEQRGWTVNLTREPGGTPLGERLRDLLLDPAHERMDDRTELFMYMAARAQHVAERIRPALQRGEAVISDRFADASLVYQGRARKADLDWVRRLNDFATRELVPDLTIILDVPVREGLDDARKGSKTRWNTNRGDRLERETDEFHRSVREGYRELAEEEPDRCVLLERTEDIPELQDRIRTVVRERLDVDEPS